MISKFICVFRLVKKEMRITSQPLKRNGQVVTDENGQPKMRSFAILRGAVDRSYTDAKGNKITDFHNFIAVNGLGETLFKYLDKGRKIMAVCNVETRKYKVGDKTITTPAFIIEEFTFLDPKTRDTVAGDAVGQEPADESIVSAEDAALTKEPVLTEELEDIAVDDDDNPF